ncbi:hypothetical protein TYRP_021897 [Tyrophagus putrescentiae]|nr:hypothetical protein TYRP_021897 [Tyrophagus putrescentiae]
MSSLVDQTEKFQFVEPSPSVLKHSSLLHNIFRMSLKPCKGSTLSALFPPHRKLSGAYRMHHGCSSLATVLLFLLCTSSLLVGASLRHSSSSLLNLIGLQQSPAVASFGPSSGAASLSTSSQSLLSSTSSNAKLLNAQKSLQEYFADSQLFKIAKKLIFADFCSKTGFSSSMHNLKGQSGTSQSLDDEPQRWHTVSAFVGGEVSLPCAIDVVHCGRVYFITWTKNGSTTYSQVLSPVPTTSTASASKPNIKPKSNGDWQRVFIHSESFESVLGDLEANGPAGRVSFGPKEKMNATNFVFLTVKSVTANDEGVYKCDVTYVKGKCPSLTYTRVQTLALTGVIWLIGIVRRLGTQLASSLCPKPSVPINQMTPAFNIWGLFNARRLGPRSLRSRDPRRRTFLVSQVKPDLAALCRAPINSDNLTGGSPWLHLGDHQRPPPRTLLAPLAKPSATGVGSRPTAHPDVTWAMCNARRLGPCSLRSQGPKRRALHIAQVTSDLAAPCWVLLARITVLSRQPTAAMAAATATRDKRALTS